MYIYFDISIVFFDMGAVIPCVWKYLSLKFFLATKTSPFCCTRNGRSLASDQPSAVPWVARPTGPANGREFERRSTDSSVGLIFSTRRESLITGSLALPVRAVVLPPPNLAVRSTFTNQTSD